MALTWVLMAVLAVQPAPPPDDCAGPEKDKAAAALEQISNPLFRQLAAEIGAEMEKAFGSRTVSSVLDVSAKTELCIRKSPTFRALVDAKGCSTFCELVRGSSQPFMMFVGVEGLKLACPDEVPGAAIHTLLRTDIILGSVQAPLHTALAHESGTRKLLDRLVSELHASRPEEVQQLQLGLMLHKLELRPLLDEWFHEPGRTRLPISFEAQILQAVFNQRQLAKQVPSEAMLAALEECAMVPGVPQAVFAANAKPSHPKFREAMVALLESEQLDSAEMWMTALFHHAGWVKNNLDVQALKVSQERREIIQTAIERLTSPPDQASSKP